MSITVTHKRKPANCISAVNAEEGMLCSAGQPACVTAMHWAHVHTACDPHLGKFGSSAIQTQCAVVDDAQMQCIRQGSQLLLAQPSCSALVGRQTFCCQVQSRRQEKQEPPKGKEKDKKRKVRKPVDLDVDRRMLAGDALMLCATELVRFLAVSEALRGLMACVLMRCRLVIGFLGKTQVRLEHSHAETPVTVGWWQMRHQSPFFS